MEMLELKDPICETLPDEEYSGHNRKQSMNLSKDHQNLLNLNNKKKTY